MDRRNLLLNEMGITRWQLYRPEVLQGAVGVSVSEQVKFIVVANDNLSSSPLFADIRLALELKKKIAFAWISIKFNISRYNILYGIGYWLKMLMKSTALCLIA